MPHRCFEHATVDESGFELVDGYIRGTAQAVCSVCGADLTYEYVLDRTVDDSGEVDYVNC
ncbi:hypothetical protein EGH25_06080 [Haladaptatus sp. F3-133]|jgi:hypothetical protein|uniref:Uncharacterized protein n=1 Tax=Halorutilus salinus TaxID=2487751 RepID=A0A9Q4GJ59_9EURY|nr:hypothetical protein [Halorutilus salinus]MCX2818916.1 hypothetical protein [Halorutilus salinus]